MSKGTRRVGWKMTVVIVCTVVLAAAASVLGLAGAADDESALTPADLAKIGELVREWDESRFTPWPTDSYDRTTYTEAEATAVRQGYLNVVKRVGTEEFQKHPMVDFPVVSFLEGYRQSDTVLLKYECKLLGTEFVRFDRGDAIVHVQVWVGEVVGELDGRSAEVVGTTRYDRTPVWEARMRDTEEGWKIVGLRTRWDSEDLDPECYGPDTAHSMQYVPVEWSGEP
ncbi:MAG TPA: hypothetical protein PLB30_09875 [Thermoleophilia bacterium]|nr:hypothetical protein [Thermoleophilia bacterium]HQJ98827.1 hypothetical protein [Thermoleophilia bacterium]